MRFRTEYSCADVLKVGLIRWMFFSEGFELGSATRLDHGRVCRRSRRFKKARLPDTTSAFTLTELAVTLAILGILFGVVLPNALNSRTTAQTEACIANLKAIDAAKHQWATDNRVADNAKPKDSDIYGPTLYLKGVPVCPADGKYSLRAVNKNPTCSISNHKL